MRSLGRRLESRARVLAAETQARLVRVSGPELLAELRASVARGEYPPPKRFAQAMRLLTEEEDGTWPAAGVKVSGRSRERRERVCQS